MVVFIPCMCCGAQYPQTWKWMICDKCGYRICLSCQGRHEGPYGRHGSKCSQCTYGLLQGPKSL